MAQTIQNKNSNRRKPVQARAIKRRAQLIEGAIQAISEVGASDLTMRSVARHANIGLGTVYDYFPSRSDLLAEIARDWFDKRLEVLSQAVGDMSEGANFYDFIGVYRDKMRAEGFWSDLDREIHAVAKNDEKVAEVLREYRDQLLVGNTRFLKYLGSEWTERQLRPVSQYILNLGDQLEPGANFQGNANDRKIVQAMISKSIANAIRTTLSPYDQLLEKHPAKNAKKL